MAQQCKGFPYFKKLNSLFRFKTEIWLYFIFLLLFLAEFAARLHLTDFYQATQK